MACFLKHLEGYRNKCTKILKQACKTRWLSFEASIVAAMEDLIPVVQTLNELSESDASAYGLLKRMHSAHFIGLLFILHAVLPILGRISRIFQKGYVNFSSIRPTLDCAISELHQIESGKSPIESSNTELKQDGRLELLELSNNYVKALIENVERRFPDVPVLVTLNIFNPCNIPDQEHVSFHTYGDDSIEIIQQQFLDSDLDTTLDELKAE